MKRPKIKPRNVEGTFGVEELFFSTTDRAGVIRSGNSVFARLSRYPLVELLGAPHNVIRHPAMPRAVFKLLWDYLHAGRTIGAYVNNLAADGSHYWVFAVVTPIPGGYLSIRLKPTSTIFQTVQSLYGTLLETEEASRQRCEPPREGMARSTEQLGGALGSLGFDGYDAFMHAALQEEMRCRDEAMGGAKSAARDRTNDDPRIATRLGSIRRARTRLDALREHLGALVTLQRGLGEKASFADAISRRFQRTATNTAIRAASFGSRTQALGTIAAHLGSSARDVQRGAAGFHMQAGTTVSTLNRNGFHLETVRLALEASERFCLEAQSGAFEEPDAPASRQTLDAILEDLAHASASLLDEVEGSVGPLGRDLRAMGAGSEELRRTVLMLRFGQLAGVIESARLNAQATVGPLLAEIGTSIEQAQLEFSELTSQIDGLSARVVEMPRMIAEIRASAA